MAKALQARGYQVHRNIGIAGFFIDLAVADLEHPGRYLVGIECDGAGYHSARSARDRDRLRQTVLEDHGWIMCRIWSTDWFQRPKEQLERVISSIEAAKIELGMRRETAVSHTRAVPVEVVAIERDETTEIGLVKSPEQPSGSHLYVEAVLSRPSHRTGELHQTPTSVLTRLVEEAVAVEGPVHAQEVINRLRDAWGLKRAGSRIQEAVEVAIGVAVNLGRLQRDGQFLSGPGTTPKVRDRSQVASPGLRKPEMLPPAEIRVAVVDIVRINFGATNDQIIQAVSRTLGFKSTSPQLRETIQAAVDDSIAVGALSRQGEMLIAAAGVST